MAFLFSRDVPKPPKDLILSDEAQSDIVCASSRGTARAQRVRRGTSSMADLRARCRICRGCRLHQKKLAVRVEPALVVAICERNTMFNWVKKIWTSSRRSLPTRTFQPCLEALEDRLVPAFALRLTGTQVILPLSQDGTYATGTGSANPADNNQGFTFNGNNFTGTGGFQQSYSFKQGNSNLIVFNPNSNTGGKTVTVTNISSGNLLAARVTSNIYGTPASGLQMVKTYSFDVNSNDVLVT